MAAQDFTVTFDGPAVADGRIAVRDLAPSLMALGDLFDLAREQNAPDLPQLSLEVRAFRPGSFDNLLGLAYDAGVALLVADPTAAVTNLLTIVTHGKNGVLAVARALRGKRIVETEPADQRDYSIAKNNQGQQIVAPNSVFNLYADERSFELLSTFFQPLRKPGYEKLEITGTPAEPFVARREEVQEMSSEAEPPEQLEGVEVARSERETVLSIVSAPLQNPVDHKWKFNEGRELADIWARVRHASWLADLETHREHLDIGDRIRCRLVQIQKDHPEKGLRVEYEVAEVLEHLGPPPRPLQNPLFGKDDG